MRNFSLLSYFSLKSVRNVLFAAGVAFVMLVLQVLTAQSADACAITFTNPLAGDFTSGTYTVTWTDDGAPDCANVVNIRYNSPTYDGGTQVLINAIPANQGAIGVNFNTMALHSGDAKEDSLDYTITGDIGGPTIGSVGTFGIDNTDPVISAAETADSDLDGVVDQIIVTINDGANGSGMGACTTAGWAITDNDGVVTPISVDNCTVDSLTQVTLDVSPTTPADFYSDATPQVVYTQGANGNTDRAGNELATVGAFDATDGSAPAPVSAIYEDLNEDGTVEILRVTLSENYGTYTHDNGAWTFPENTALNLTVIGGAGGGGTFIDLNVTADADETSTAVDPTIVYTQSGASVIDDGTNTQAGPTVAAIVADAAPASILSARSISATQIEVTFSETVDKTQFVVGGGDFVVTDTAFDDLGDTTITAVDNTGTGTTTTLTINGPIAAAFADYPNNTVAYSALGIVEDGNPAVGTGNFNTLTPAVPIDDGVLATIVSAVTNDVAGNGKVDQVIVTMSEAVTDAGTYAVGADTTPFLQVTGYDVTAVAGNGTAVLTYTVAEDVNTCDATDQTGCDTDATPALTFDATNAQDGGSNDVDLTGAPANAADGADPAVVGFRYESSGGNGSVDNAIFVVSEPVTFTAANVYDDFTITDGGLTSFDDDGTPESMSGTGTDTVTLVTTGTTGDTGSCGGAEPTLAYANDAANFMVDAVGNPVADFGPSNLDDYARPVVTNYGNTLGVTITAGTPTAHPLYGTTAGSVTAQRIITFSECLLTGQTDASGFTYQNYVNLNDITISSVSTDGSDQLTINLDVDDGDNFTGRHNYGYDETTGTIVDDSTQGNEIANEAPSTLSNVIPPVAYDFVYRSSGNNDVVDEAYIFLTETVVDAAALGDWAVNNQNLTGFDDDGTPDGKSLATTTYTNDTIVLNTTGTSELTGVSGGTEPDVTYTAGGNYTDLDSSDLASFGPTSLADEAGPIALDSVGGTFSEYYDALNTGSVTAATLRFTEDVNWSNTAGTYYVDGDWTATANGLTGFDFTSSTDVNGDDVIAFNATSTNLTGVGAGTEPQMSHPGGDLGADASIVDGAGNFSEAFTVNFTDDADPVLVGFTAVPDPAGLGDTLTFDLDFSEDMDSAVPLTGMQFDVNPTTGSGPYGVTADVTAGNTNGFDDTALALWEGDYDTNPIAVGVPESGVHEFTSNWDAQDPTGNVMAVLTGLDLTFVIDSDVPDTYAVTVSPNPVDRLLTDFLVTAHVSDSVMVAGADWYIVDQDLMILGSGAMDATDGAFDDPEEHVFQYIDLSTILPSYDMDYMVYIIGYDGGGNYEVQDEDNSETFTSEENPNDDPEFYITQPAAGSTVGSTFNLSVDADGSAVGCEYDVAPFIYGAGTAMTQTGTSFYADITAADGAYVYYVACIDGDGLVNVRSRGFNVSTADLTPPAAGALNYATAMLGANSIAGPTNGWYDIGDISNADSFVSMDITVTDANLDTTDRAVYVDGVLSPVATLQHAGGGLWNLVLTGSITFAPGVHDLEATFDDTEGNSTTIGVRFTTVVEEGPDFYITQPTAGATIESPFMLAVDTDGTPVGCEYDEGAPFSYGAGTAMTNTGTSYYANITVADGTYTYYVVCSDGIEESMRARDFTVATGTGDVTPPSIDIVTPVNVQTTLTPTLDITYSDDTAVDGTLTVVKVDGADVTADLTVTATNAAGALTTPLTDLAWYTVYVYVEDTSGNYAETTYNFYVDTGATDTVSPLLSGNPSPVVTTTDTNPTVTISFTDNAGFDPITPLNNIAVYTIDGVDAIPGNPACVTISGGANQNFDYACTTGVLPLGVHTVTFQVVDLAGNLSDLAVWSFEIVDSDLVPPVLESTSPDTEQVTGAVAPVVFVFSDAAFADAGNDDDVKNESDIVEFTMDTTDISNDANTTAVLSNSDQTLTLTYTDANMPVGVHNFNVVVEDASGNTREASMTVNVVAGGDTTPPITTVSILDINTTGATMVVSADEDVTYDFDVDDDPLFGSPEATGVGQTIVVPAPSLVYMVGVLSPDTIYYVRVVATDAATNSSTSIYAFRTNDEGAPVLMDILYTPDATSPSTAGTVTWNTELDVDGVPSGAVNTDNNVVEYGTDTTLGSTGTTTTTDGVSTHSADLTALSPATDYYFRVRSDSTANGKRSYSQIFHVITAQDDTGIAVEGISMVKTYAVADDTYTNGWEWRFNITINDVTETLVAMRFAQWVSGTNLIDAANNMQYSIDGVTWTTITANGTYGADIDVSGVDLSTMRAGRQITLYVRMKVPVGSAGGSYTSSYGIQAL